MRIVKFILEDGTIIRTIKNFQQKFVRDQVIAFEDRSNPSKVQQFLIKDIRSFIDIDDNYCVDYLIAMEELINKKNLFYSKFPAQ